MTSHPDRRPQANPWERRLFWATRLLTLVAVLGSLTSAVVMFFLGAANTVDALRLMGRRSTPGEEEIGLPPDETMIVMMMDGLDRFLIGLVLLFFAYGVYGLFIRPELTSRELGLPEWVHVERIGQLKQKLAEVIVVVLFVLFLRVALQTFHEIGVPMSTESLGRFLLLPVSILLLAAALRLAQLHRTEERPHAPPPAESSPED
jgi:uncharacterized membrane protein YqhA